MEEENKICNLEYIQSGITKQTPQIIAIHWCMIATKINRIFYREDLSEFIFRLALVLDSMYIIENWFGDDRLINFKYKDLVYTLTKEDLINHFGIEIIDRIDYY